MKKLQLIWFCSYLLFLSGCQSDPPDATVTESGTYQDSLVFSKDTLKHTLSCQSDSGKNYCLEIFIETLAVTEGGTRNSRKEINNFINEQLSQNDNAEMEADTPDEMAEQLMLEYQRIQREMPGYEIPWEYRKKLKVYLNDHGLFGVDISSYSFTGGAHPSYFTEYYLWDIDNGKRLRVEDLLQNGSYAQLQKLAEQQFIENRNIDTSATYEEAGYWFENDQFSLTENFLFTPQKLNFIYNTYEIAPFSEGVIKISFNYRDIERLLKPEYRF